MEVRFIKKRINFLIYKSISRSFESKVLLRINILFYGLAKA